jgi:YHS domain-containing protein
MIFLVAFAALYWLYRNRERFASGARYAIDPVCGMQVEKDLAPARTTFDGATVFFCSDHCRQRFEKEHPVPAPGSIP